MRQLPAGRRAQHDAVHTCQYMGAERSLGHQSRLGVFSRAACPARSGLILRKPRSKAVLPFWARSARISPITLQNLKPWPEQAEQTSTCAHGAGSASTGVQGQTRAAVDTCSAPTSRQMHHAWRMRRQSHQGRLHSIIRGVGQQQEEGQQTAPACAGGGGLSGSGGPSCRRRRSGPPVLRRLWTAAALAETRADTLAGPQPGKLSGKQAGYSSVAAMVAAATARGLDAAPLLNKRHA